MSASQERLDVIVDLIEEYYLSEADILLSTKRFLDNIYDIARGKDIKEVKRPKKENKIIISCDASIVNNPGGPAGIAFIIEFPENFGRKPLEINQLTNDTTINLAEYNAIYSSLVTLFNLYNNPHCQIEVRSDSQIAINQIKNKIKCADEKLRNRRDIIQDFVKAVPVEIIFKWRPRLSTLSLKRADYLAKQALGIEE
jgi:ribonuclease HI